MTRSHRTSPAELLPLLQTRIRDRLVTDREFLPSNSCVQITALDPRMVPHFQASYEVLIWPQDEQARDEFQTGGGRVDHRSTRMVSVCCRTRVDLDPTGSDAYRLTDSSLGHYLLEFYVKDALAIFTPLSLPDDNGYQNEVTDFPIHWIRTTRSDPDQNDPGSWVSSTLLFEVPYEDDFDQDFQ